MMSKNRVTLLLGTNLGDRKINLEEAIRYIENRVGDIFSKSKINETKPMGFTANMDFYNQIIQANTKLSPVKLLKTIKEIEQNMGRVYTKPKDGEKYTSRVIDIDILFYNDINYRSSKLTLPHKQVYEREFVKDMLAEFS